MIIVGLNVNVVTPANATPNSKLPVVVVSTPNGILSHVLNSDNPLGSGYMGVRRTQCLRTIALTNIIYYFKGGFEEGTSSRYG